MFVTPYSDDELYPAGLYINQHPGGKDFGVQAWVNRDEPIENKDVVLWPCELTGSLILPRAVRLRDRLWRDSHLAARGLADHAGRDPPSAPQAIRVLRRGFVLSRDD